MKKKIILLLALVLLSCSALFAQAEPAVQEVVLQELVAEAAKNNPQVQAAYQNWQSQVHKITSVSSLPDPMASYAYFGDSVETRVGPQEEKYGVSQKVPFPGKLNLKAKSQTKQAAVLQQKYQALKRSIIKQVKFVYNDIFWVEQAIQITEEEKSILEDLERVVQRKYESNLAPQQDVLKVQVELSRLIDKLFLLRQNRKSLAVKMNILLDRPKDSEFGAFSVEPEEFKYELDQLHQIAQGASQKLLAANLEIERAEYERSLAKLDYLPDFTFGFDYTKIADGTTTQTDDGQDAWMGKVMVNLPIWFNKLSAQAKEKQAKLEASKSSLENAKNEIVFEVEDLYYKIMAYRDILSLYQTALIPQTEQAFGAARVAYESGVVDFLNWLDAERALLQTRLAYYKTIVDYQKSIAYLESVVGKDL
ncbi:TolC family protein [Candidatus Omnitrophota bacterium]